MRLLKLKKKKTGGFSLTETMVATAIGLVVISGFYMGLSVSFSLLEIARQNLRATQILVERSETLRLLKWTQVTEPGFIPATFQESYSPFDQDGIKYFGTISLQQPSGPENYTSRMRYAVIELQWRSGDTLRKRSVRTMISRDGIQNYVF